MAFCHKRKIDKFQVNVTNVVEFLTELFQSGNKYESLNTARSALSAFCTTEDGYTAGSHPLVVRFMSGVFNLTPPKCKYEDTWDVSKVLRYLKTLSPDHNLTLKLLSQKLAMLIALTQASRCHSLSLITLDGHKQDQDCFTLQYCGLLKQSRKGRGNPVLQLRKYSLDRNLCVYSTLVEYIKKTECLRGSETRLFISYIKPYKVVTSSTISRWLKAVMLKSGIDIQKFQSHSIRGASTSKAKIHGVSMNEIMRVAGWKNDRTFATYYNKPVEDNSFVLSVFHESEN